MITNTYHLIPEDLKVHNQKAVDKINDQLSKIDWDEKMNTGFIKPNNVILETFYNSIAFSYHDCKLINKLKMNIELQKSMCPFSIKIYWIEKFKENNKSGLYLFGLMWSIRGCTTSI